MSRTGQVTLVVVVLVGRVGSGCGRKRPAVPQPAPAPGATTQPPAVTNAPPAPPERIGDALPVPPQPLSDDAIANRSLDELNRDSPLKPVFFGLDSADLDDV